MITRKEREIDIKKALRLENRSATNESMSTERISTVNQAK